MTPHTLVGGAQTTLTARASVRADRRNDPREARGPVEGAPSPDPQGLWTGERGTHGPSVRPATRRNPLLECTLSTTVKGYIGIVALTLLVLPHPTPYSLVLAPWPEILKVKPARTRLCQSAYSWALPPQPSPPPPSPSPPSHHRLHDRVRKRYRIWMAHARGSLRYMSRIIHCNFRVSHPCLE
jgi:hypothetical protein